MQWIYLKENHRKFFIKRYSVYLFWESQIKIGKFKTEVIRHTDVYRRFNVCWPIDEKSSLAFRVPVNANGICFAMSTKIEASIHITHQFDLSMENQQTLIVANLSGDSIRCKSKCCDTIIGNFKRLWWLQIHKNKQTNISLVHNHNHAALTKIGLFYYLPKTTELLYQIARE